MITKIGCLVTGLVAVVIAVVLGVYLLSTYNAQATLLNTYNMKVKDNQSEFDNMFKKISQVTQISVAKKDAFKEVFTAYAEARTSKSQNQMMTWVKENAPNFDLSIYDKVLNVITGSRDSWTFRQKELVGIAEQYNLNLSVQPRGFILKLFGFQIIDPKIITSSRTEEAFRTGKDDDTKLELGK